MTREERKEAIEYLKKYRELDERLYQTAPFTSVAHNALVKCLRHWDTAIQALREEPDPCDFCSTIYPDADTKDILFRRGKYSDGGRYRFITVNDEGKYYINIDPGDPYEAGYLCDIKFCPYCGRKLAESENMVPNKEEEDDCADIYCENCRNNYNCIEYLEEQERMNEEDDE